MGITEQYLPDGIPEQSPTYTYLADVEEVIDGDTVDVRIDLGFEQRMLDRVRIREVDAREIHFVSHDSEEYKRGMVHTEFVEQWVADARENGGEWPFVLASVEYDRGTYGRIVGDLWRRDAGEWLAATLYEEFDDVDVV